MGTPVVKPRSLWEDRFARPTIQQLLGACPKTLAGVLDHARERLGEVEGVQEELSWQGIPWRWTLVYRHEADRERAFAFVVPDPMKPRLAVPIPNVLVPGLLTKRITKGIRETLVHSPVVGTIRWCQWEASTQGQVEEIVALAELKLTATADVSR